MPKTRYFYCYESTLCKHFHFYKALSDVCKENDIKLELITFIKFNMFFKNRERMKRLSPGKGHEFLSLNHNITEFVYFFFIILLHKRTVIHFKQTHPGRLSLLKKLFPTKIIFLSDLEGDKISERQFLSNISQSEALLNRETKKEIDDLILQQRRKLNLFDYVFVQTSHFENMLKRRHSQLNCQIIVSHLMSFKKGKLFFDEELRKEFRKKLAWEEAPIITYIGNVFYPWQNLSKTIKIYKRVKEELNLDAKLLLLVNEKDHARAMEFINKFKLEKSDFFLTEVRNDEINGYLNASDIGIVLRDFHEMNKAATSGKLLDYLGCGLPIITTSVLLNFINNSDINQYGIILTDLNVESIPIQNISKFLGGSNSARKEVSTWANKNLSLDAMSSEYINLLKQLKD